MHMDFENLGDISVGEESADDESLYKIVKDRKKIRVTNVDVEKAKAFLSSVSSESNTSLYDHLLAVLRSVLRSKIDNAFDNFENISREVKERTNREDGELLEVAVSDERLQKFIEDRKQFFKFKAKVDISEEIKLAEEDEVDDEEEEEEEEEEKEEEEETVEEEGPDLSLILPDLYYISHRFSLAGIGLSFDETFDLWLSLKNLVEQFKLQKVRFWGKVFTYEACYYVAEAPYQPEIVPEDFGWKIEGEEEHDAPEEEDGESEDKGDEEGSGEEEEDKETDAENAEGDEEGKPDADDAEKEEPLPPIPEPMKKTKKLVLPEEAGTGVNEYLYFVCTRFGQPWRCLPLLKPYHLTEARQIKRFFTGDLESEIRGCVWFSGKEAHYLRAQIARISASTCIAPVDYFIPTGGDDDEEEEENEDDGEESEDNKKCPIRKNRNYVAKSVKELLSDGLEAWVHSRQAILDQGRCTPMKKEGDDEDEEEEEVKEPEEDGEEDEEKEEGEDEESEEPEILEAIKETSVPLLRVLSEDKAIGRLDPWCIRLSSQMVSEKATLIVRSNLWPGAYTFYDAKSFEHIYIGFGYKYSVYHYAPPIRVAWQKEYKVGADVIEHVDESTLKEEEEKEEGDESESKGEDEDEDETEEGDEED